MTLRIKNWNKFQHFKDRKPPWVKLYRDILDDIQWHRLSGDAAKALTGLWVIASENGGKLPSEDELAFRLRINETLLNEILGELTHFLEHDDVNLISSRHQVDPLEGETETYNKETEEEEELEGARARQPATRPSRLSSDWKPPEEEWIWVAAAFPRLDAKAETDKFRDHFLANGKVMAKWHHTWRNWMRRAVGYQSNAPVTYAKPKGFLERYADEIEEQRILEQQEGMKHVRAITG